MVVQVVTKIRVLLLQLLPWPVFMLVPVPVAVV
jgi:hypothetical protein